MGHKQCKSVVKVLHMKALQSRSICPPTAAGNTFAGGWRHMGLVRGCMLATLEASELRTLGGDHGDYRVSLPKPIHISSYVGLQIRKGCSMDNIAATSTAQDREQGDTIEVDFLIVQKGSLDQGGDAASLPSVAAPEAREAVEQPEDHS
jgi:hypothetical protein